jgi:hypothetical protein
VLRENVLQYADDDIVVEIRAGARGIVAVKSHVKLDHGRRNRLPEL